MKHFDEKSGNTYEAGINMAFAELNISGFKNEWCHMNLDTLRKFIADTQDLPGDTPILYENIDESLLLEDVNNGWKVTPMIWDEYKGRIDYMPCIHAWQVMKTKDKEGKVGIVFTAHY